MRRTLLTVSILALLAACSKAEESAPALDAATDAVATSEAAAPAGAGRAAAVAKPEAPAVSAPMLAYAYSYRLGLPAKGVRSLMARHQAACEAAGPELCQVVGAESRAVGRDDATASLELRAAASWLTPFRAALAQEVGSAGGKIETAATQSEDLTRQIIDTEAYIRARVTMRDRLVRMLAERPGKLQDVLAVEQELARVQGEIDSTQSALAVMRTRVATSRLTLTYASLGVAAPDGVASPLARAADSFLGIVLMVLAGLVNLLSFLLPIGLVAAPVVWLIARRRKARPAKAEPLSLEA